MSLDHCCMSSTRQKIEWQEIHRRYSYSFFPWKSSNSLKYCIKLSNVPSIIASKLKNKSEREQFCTYYIHSPQRNLPINYNKQCSDPQTQLGLPLVTKLAGLEILHYKKEKTSRDQDKRTTVAVRKISGV